MTLFHQRFTTRVRSAFFGLLLAATAASNVAQAGQASLVADHVRVDGDSGLVAEGNVVVIYEDAHLSATRVSYDKTTDRLIIEGPIRLTRGDDILIVADAADLSADLRNGILSSARVVLDQQLQIAAAHINRVQDRYTQMSRVVASSCQVCAQSPVPLWQIRADRVVHDEKERQLYFHGAQFRVADVPVFYLPRLRLPDPTLKRATGFLPPKIRTSSILGTGIVAPYFLRLGDHADLTFSPFLSSRTTTLEWRYRHVFRSGDIQFDGAISQDTILPDQTRFYLFGSGQFDLPRDFTLSFDLQETSDPGYLLDYGYSDQDRLRNAVNVMRARRDEFIFAGITRFDTLRESEIPISEQLPFAQIDALYERRFFPQWALGGEIQAQISWQAHFRESTDDILGRDMARVGTALSWRRDWIGPAGIVFEAETEFDASLYVIEQDSNFETEQSFATPSAGITLRWPMSRVSANGETDVIEPVAHLAWSEQVGADVPNEDSAFVEFDQANLFDLSRFPGNDRQEEGLRGAVGVTWSRHSPSGWAFTLAAGRVFREVDTGQFTDASGLAGSRSDWLLGVHANLDSRFAVQGRALIDDNFDLTKAETRALFLSGDLELGATHIWVIDDTEENRPDPTHELRLDGAYQLNDFWRLSADSSIDVEARQATRAALGLAYRNECVLVELSLSRRFTSSINVTPTTDFGLQIELTGFGGAKGGPSQKCGI